MLYYCMSMFFFCLVFLKFLKYWVLVIINFCNRIFIFKWLFGNDIGFEREKFLVYLLVY